MSLYAVFLYASADAEKSDPNPEAEAEHDRHAQEIASQMVFGSRLTESDASTSIRAGGITDGPFLDTKEVVVGFYVLDAPDLDAALAVAQRNPILHQGGGVEVRPIDA